MLKIFNKKLGLMLFVAFFVAVFASSAIQPALALNYGRSRWGIYMNNVYISGLAGISGVFYTGDSNRGNWYVDYPYAMKEHYCQIAMTSQSNGGHYIETGIDVYYESGAWHKAIFFANDGSLVYFNHTLAESLSEPITLTITKSGVAYTLYANMQQLHTTYNTYSLNYIMTEFEGTGLPYSGQYNLWVGGVHSIQYLWGSWTAIGSSLTKGDWNWGTSIAGYLTAGGWDCRINI